MEDNKMGQLGFKIDTGELATSTIPEDFTAPEELYKKLITMIRKYHPSDDISMIEKAYQMRGSFVNRGNHISSIRSVSV